MVRRVLVNGLRARSGGGRSILHNYLELLSESDCSEMYFILTPRRSEAEFERYVRPGLTLVGMSSLYQPNAFFPLLSWLGFPRLLRRLDIDLVFNLGDIPIPTSRPQVFLFDWAYALYPDSVAWSRMELRSRIGRQVKVAMFRALVRHVDLIVAQTETARRRLERIHGLDKVVVVPNAVSLDNLDEDVQVRDEPTDERIRLLYLSHWYPHKNFEVLLPLARLIRERGLPMVLVITIDPDEHRSARRFLQAVRRGGLHDAIENLGSVPMDRVRTVYRSSDALLMPTLLESFSGCYVEAMYHGLPIFTSDMDFARDICGDVAYYFDPLSPISILETVERAFSDRGEMSRRVRAGRSRLAAMPGWPAVFAVYQTLIGERLVEAPSRLANRQP